MNVLILNDEEVSELKVINQANAHLLRRLEPGRLKDGSAYLDLNTLKDTKNWKEWVSFLKKLKIKRIFPHNIKTNWELTRKNR